MDARDRTLFLTQAELAFFEAMQQGYAAGVEAKLLEGHPGWKVYEWHNAHWRVEDGYYVNPDTGKSFGNTHIEHEGKLIWCMSYAGFYYPDAANSLKWSLLETYQKNQFVGGRGPLYHKNTCFEYYNMPVESKFENFHGYEQILNERAGHRVWGWHRYFGMALI